MQPGKLLLNMELLLLLQLLPLLLRSTDKKGQQLQSSSDSKEPQLQSSADKTGRQPQSSEHWTEQQLQSGTDRIGQQLQSSADRTEHQQPLCITWADNSLITMKKKYFSIAS